MTQSTCRYSSHSYYNVENKSDEIFICSRNALINSEYCEFHDSTYFTISTKLNLQNQFERIVTDALTNSEELYCIGYILPAINLDGKKFLKNIYFTGAKFHEESSFANCEFHGMADFSRCEFKDNISFTGAVFKSEVKFSHSVISSSIATFQNVTYEKKADFKNFTTKNILFTMNTFDKVFFIGATFNGQANFWNSNFNNKCDFSLSTFEEKVIFSGSKFKKEATFEQVNFKNFANFRRILFKKQEKIFFNTNLKNVSFLETDIKRVRFGNGTIFNEHELKIPKFLKNTRYKIIDEKMLENKEEPDLDLESVMDVYRNLRDNYDYQLRYDVAGEFFVREMEIKRKYKKNKPSASVKTLHKNCLRQRVSILGVYNLIAQYGHSYYRPIFAAIPILLVSTLYFVTRGHFDYGVLLTNLHSQEIVKDAGIRSLSSFFPFYTFNKYNTIADFLLRIILLPVSGSFFITLKRKLERKFRY